MIRLVALDLDGTALHSSGAFSPRTRRALEQAVARGVHVVVASGRPFRSLPDCLWQVEGLEYAVWSNGAAVSRLADGACLHRNCLPPEQVLAVLELLEPYPLAMEGAVDGVAYAAQAYVEDPEAFGAPAAAVTYIRRTRQPVPDIRRFLWENREGLEAMDVVVSDPSLKEKLREQLEGLGGLYVTSSVPHLLELASREAGKASALAWLAEQLSIGQEEIMAFGNAENDRDMIRFAGVGVVVADSPESLQDAADMVTAACDQDGVAQTLEQWMQEGRM